MDAIEINILYDKSMTCVPINIDVWYRSERPVTVFKQLKCISNSK